MCVNLHAYAHSIAFGVFGLNKNCRRRRCRCCAYALVVDSGFRCALTNRTPSFEYYATQIYRLVLLMMRFANARARAQKKRRVVEIKMKEFHVRSRTRLLSVIIPHNVRKCAQDAISIAPPCAAVVRRA